MLPPCRENGIPCPDRKPGCHGNCKRFRIYRDFVESRRKEREKRRFVDDARFELAANARKKSKHS